MKLSQMTLGTLFLILVIMIIGHAAIAAPPARGTASWYGAECAGRLMANGLKFDPAAMTAASWFYPLGTKLRVSNAGGASVIVEITDRGPARRLVAQGRIIDLSRGAFQKLDKLDKGLIKISVEPAR